MDRFEALQSLVAAVDHGSLSAAARATATPLATISRRVADLEAHLGAQLLIRTSRKLVPTEVGEAFVATARKLLEDLGDAERLAAGEYRAPRGELVVTAPIGLGKLHVAPIVHAFLAAYPEVSVRLVLSDTLLDLVDAHVDVAVRVGHLPDSGLRARKAGQVRWMLAASPDYLARKGLPQTLDDLAALEGIALEGLPDPRLWPLLDAGRPATVRIRPRLSINTAEAAVEAAIAGVGVVRAVSYQAARAIEDGRLVPILRDAWPAPMPVQLVHGDRRQPLKQTAFLDFVLPRLRNALEHAARIVA
nr:LysR family transcriptional regulator [uncultured Sphingomonas sp.]